MLTFDKKRLTFAALVLALAFVLTLCPVRSYAEQPIVPFGSRITVFATDGNAVNGDVKLTNQSGYARVAETSLKRDLRKAGKYKIADAGISDSLKREALKSLAKGNSKKAVAAVKKFGIDYIVHVSLSDHEADLNDFKTYTSSNTVMVQIVSTRTGEYVFDDMISAKALGGTREEAIRLAVQKAAAKIVPLIMGEEDEDE